MQYAEHKSLLKDRQAPRAGLHRPTRLAALPEGQELAGPERLALRVAEPQRLWQMLMEALGLPARAH